MSQGLRQIWNAIFARRGGDTFECIDAGIEAAAEMVQVYAVIFCKDVHCESAVFHHRFVDFSAFLDTDDELKRLE